jgi:uncharacterized cupin superfamily protein
MNLRDLELEPVDGAPPGHAFAVRSLTRELGATRTGLSVYAVPPGEKTWPYHFELGEEEWIVVIEGRIILRTPRGEERLEAGDVVCCPIGPGGAHAVRNDSDATARFMMLSNVSEDADGAVYPDSGTFVVRTTGWSHRGRLGEPVPYWEGET